MKQNNDDNTRQNHIVWPIFYRTVIRVSNKVYSNIGCILAKTFPDALTGSESISNCHFATLSWTEGWHLNFGMEHVQAISCLATTIVPKVPVAQAVGARDFLKEGSRMCEAEGIDFRTDDVTCC